MINLLKSPANRWAFVDSSRYNGQVKSGKPTSSTGPIGSPTNGGGFGRGARIVTCTSAVEVQPDASVSRYVNVYVPGAAPFELNKNVGLTCVP